MEDDRYPDSSVRLARLLQGYDSAASQSKELLTADLSLFAAGESPSKEILGRLSEMIGMRSEDLYLVAGLRVPGDEVGFDRRAGGELPRLVKPALSLSASGRRRLREFVGSLPVLPRTVTPEVRPYERYPPGFGSLLVRMLAIRNLGWMSSAKVMARMSGVYLSAATIGAVGRGVRELDAELLSGFAAVLGISVEILGNLTGVPVVASGELPGKVTDAAALLWDARHLTADQVRKVTQRAEALASEDGSGRAPVFPPG